MKSVVSDAWPFEPPVGHSPKIVHDSSMTQTSCILSPHRRLREIRHVICITNRSRDAATALFSHQDRAMQTLFRNVLRAARPLTALVVFTSVAAAQQRATPEINRSTDPLLQSVRFRSLGPASMGGRIDDIEVSESNPNIIYLGYAVGGVYRSLNNGTSFEPVFETYGSASIGAIAIHPTNPNIVYVGTGEPNNRQTSSFGDGIYKTTDGGKTFKNIGLKETQT